MIASLEAGIVRSLAVEKLGLNGEEVKELGLDLGMGMTSGQELEDMLNAFAQ